MKKENSPENNVLRLMLLHSLYTMVNHPVDEPTKEASNQLHRLNKKVVALCERFEEAISLMAVYRSELAESIAKKSEHKKAARNSLQYFQSAFHLSVQYGENKLHDLILLGMSAHRDSIYISNTDAEITKAGERILSRIVLFKQCGNILPVSPTENAIRTTMEAYLISICEVHASKKTFVSARVNLQALCTEVDALLKLVESTLLELESSESCEFVSKLLEGSGLGKEGDTLVFSIPPSTSARNAA